MLCFGNHHDLHSPPRLSLKASWIASRAFLYQIPVANTFTNSIGAAHALERCSVHIKVSGKTVIDSFGREGAFWHPVLFLSFDLYLRHHPVLVSVQAPIKVSLLVVE
jgi:hypothetical protein